MHLVCCLHQQDFCCDHPAHHRTITRTMSTSLGDQVRASYKRAGARAGRRNITDAPSQAGGGFQCYYANDTTPACDINWQFGASGLIPAPSDPAGKRLLAYLVAGDTACRTAGNDETTCNTANVNAPQGCVWDGYDQQCYGQLPDLATFFICSDQVASNYGR